MPAISISHAPAATTRRSPANDPAQACAVPHSTKLLALAGLGRNKAASLADMLQAAGVARAAPILQQRKVEAAPRLALSASGEEARHREHHAKTPCKCRRLEGRSQRGALLVSRKPKRLYGQSVTNSRWRQAKDGCPHCSYFDRGSTVFPQAGS